MPESTPSAKRKVWGFLDTAVRQNGISFAFVSRHREDSPGECLAGK
jgi:hypothetical protein